MNSALQILVIARHFPPDAEVGAKRIALFCRYLPGCGIRPIVVTVRERFCEKRDESFPRPLGIRVERTGVLPNPLNWYGRWKARTLPRSSVDTSPPPRTTQRHRSFFSRQTLALLQTPDRYWGWYWPAVRAAERLIDREPIAAVLSSAPPFTSHLIARHLKRKYGIPWVADFRDAWASDVWRIKDLPRWRERLEHRLEKSCLCSADLVVCVTDAMREEFTRHYPTFPETKFVTLTNGFDDSVVAPASTQPQHSTRLLLHLGEIYAGRRIDTFCQAVTSLVKSGKIDPSSLKILFLGEIDPSLEATAHQLAPELIRRGSIEFLPRVRWQQAQQVLESADVLLIFQGDHRLAVTAKFYEYLRTGKPILAIVQEGALSDMLAATRSGLWADPEDPTDIASKLLDVLALPVRPPEEVERLAGQYHFRCLTERLAEWIRNLTDVPVSGARRP